MTHQTNNTSITLQCRDGTGGHITFDFSDFYNQELSFKCVEYYDIKYREGVTLNYLSHLIIAFKHYDEYMKIMGYSNPLQYDDHRKLEYEDYLYNLICDRTDKQYARKYIRFLNTIPRQLQNTLSE